MQRLEIGLDGAQTLVNFTSEEIIEFEQMTIVRFCRD